MELKKGIIFTLDAIIATVIFLIAVVMLYSYLYSGNTFLLGSSAMYTDSDDYLRTNEKGGYFSSIFKFFQEGNTLGAESLLNLVILEAPYHTNIKLYYWNITNLSLIKFTENANYNFSDKIVLNKYLVYTLYRNLTPLIKSEVLVNASSFMWSNSTIVYVKVVNSGGSNFVNVNLTPYVHDNNGNDVTFSTIPSDYTLENVTAGTNRTFSFQLELDDTLPVDEYIFGTNVTSESGLSSGLSEDPFNVIYFGFVSMEVGHE
jgi:hypothetical protein